MGESPGRPGNPTGGLRAQVELSGQLLTPDGRVWLESTQSAQPLHVFEHVVNLKNEGGELLSVSTEAVGLGPFALSIPLAEGFGEQEPGFNAHVGADQMVKVDDEILHMGSLTVRWRSAAEWDPRPSWADLRRSQTLWTDLAPQLSELLAAGAPPGGLAPLLASAETTGELHGMARQIVRAAREPAEFVMKGVQSGSLELVADGAAGLAGLGGGLTPSGDDYLIGVMHALWATQSEADARGLSRAMAYAAVARTTELSAAWVAAASKGKAAQHWHVLFEALISGEEEGLEAPVGSLLRVGHTSGADALTGFLAMLEVLERG